MSDKGEKTCPLCAEEMDLTDQQLKPCKCGYEICVWCWNHIMEMAEKDNTEGRCPACRLPYDKEKIVGMAADCERLVAEINSERKQKPQKAKPKAPEGRMHLSNVRVIKRNLVYVIGLPLDLADEDLLQRKEYFGQYGKVLKVSISRTANGVIQHSANNSCCVYVTYSKEEEAVCCIQSVHSFVLEGKPLRACFGTTKYCHAWLRNAPCNIPDCLYLHGFGSQEDSFTKDEIVSAFSRSKMQQTIGASINLHRRSGNVLPPPLPEYTSNGISSSAKPVAKTHPNNVGNENRESCVDGGTGNSTALPAAASWVKRVSASLSPVPNMSASGTISNNHPDAYAGPHIPSEVVSTKKSNDMKRTLIAEESSEIHPDCRTDSLEFKEYPDSNYKTCTSNRKADTLSNTSSAPVTCGEPDTVASKVTGVAASINIERSINYCSRSSYSSGSDDENSYTDGDFQGLSSICNLSHTKIKESAPVHDSSFSTHTSLCLPRGLSSQGDINEQSYRAPSLPVQNKSMTSKDLLDFEDKQLRSLEDICNLPSASFSDSLQQNSSGLSYNSWQKGEIKHQNELLAHSRILPVHEKVSFPMTYENLVSSNGFHNDLDGDVGDLDMSFDYSSMSGSANNKGINNAVSVENYTPDVGEDRIISKILSMELDPWEDSLTSPDSLSKLLRETKEQRGSLKPPSLRKATDNNQSRFSFARQEGFSNQASDFNDSVGSIMDFNKCSAHHHDYNAINDLCIDNYQNPYSLYSSQEPSNLLNNHNFASSKLSAPSRAPPPGFLTSGRMNLALDSAASHLLQTSEPQIKNSGSIGEVGFLDPAILEVGQGLMAMGLNKSGFDTRTSASHHSSFDHKPGFNTRTSAPQHSSFDHDARLQLAMQQSLYEHQNLGFQDHSRNRLSQSNDAYGMSPTLLDQSPAYNPFSFPQSTTQQLRNAHLSNGHGGSWNDARSYNDLRLPELLKNGGLGFSTFTPTYEDLKCQMSSSSNLYNRGFAM
ncbi:hypothetical protein CCACVL1_17696 [Corchorus capsularis]|uniref:RRM domain-containing protein n=1 Tax=Corchorus capsularis TaxID=210143 RepID=A0A1R3HR50_COCAP|nr:hypothetical protein CCACVL1_17696 [Corchorus capsularis]